MFIHFFYVAKDKGTNSQNASAIIGLKIILFFWIVPYLLVQGITFTRSSFVLLFCILLGVILSTDMRKMLSRVLTTVLHVLF